MTHFDPSQLRVLELDPERHARILGAPGSGKTTVLVETFRRVLQLPGWGERDVLVLAPNRLVASQLRPEVEKAVGRAFGGTPVRTAASLSFAVLAKTAAVSGNVAPRLLTGTVQDEVIAAVVADRLASGRTPAAGLVAEVVQSATFRTELRDFWRVLDDFGLSPRELAAELEELGQQAGQVAHTRSPDREVLDRWVEVLDIVVAVADWFAVHRPAERTSSALLRDAAMAVREYGITQGPGVADETRLQIPRLILVDDAQELGEGELALLAGCARAGSAIWVFGDPDLATGTFQGERTRVLAGLNDELARRGAFVRAPHAEQVLVLNSVYRHGSEVRALVRGLSARVGATGTGEQREALASEAAAAGTVQFVVASSPAEQLGIIAHRLRARKLGLGGADPVPWTEMAVICRSRGEASRAARILAGHQVPTGIAAGGVILREHQVVRELIRLLQHALNIRPLSAEEVLELVGGVTGGLDPVAVRRLRGALLLWGRQDAQGSAQQARQVEEIVAEAFAHPGEQPIVDSAGGRALRRVGRIAAAGTLTREAGATARETLWALWEKTGLADRWQQDALEARGGQSVEAHNSLDAVLGLFFALQRHEEQDSEQPIERLLEELLESAIPEDSLAQRSQRETVTVTTPQGTLGRQFQVVAVIGAQDGSWPNLRARGSLLGAATLERWLRGEEAAVPSRRETIHDELRLFVQSCSRARGELLVSAILDEDHHPSAFFRFGDEYLIDNLPSARLTLRGVTAQLRRQVTEDPSDVSSLRSLVALAKEGVPGAAPEEWYGVLPPSTDAPIFDLAHDPELRVPVSPSQLERAEECPLNWVIASLGGAGGSVQASLGTLVHHALETAQDPDPAALLAAVEKEWHKLPFDAEWESERGRRLAAAMTVGLADYLREFAGSERQLVGRETPFEIPIHRAMLRGMADRLELRQLADGSAEVTVVDLKTGRTPPSKAETELHAQLQAYQLGVLFGAFQLAEGEVLPEGAHSGGARLLYVHPDATRGGSFVERAQGPISDEANEELIQRVAQVAEVMAAGEFTARVEHHCSDPHTPGNCSLHIVQAVSHA